MKEFNFDDIDIIDNIDEKVTTVDNVEEVNASDVFGMSIDNSENNQVSAIENKPIENKPIENKPIENKPLYRRFNYDINIKDEPINTEALSNPVEKVPLVEPNNVDNKLDVEEVDKPLFASNTEEIDNPFVAKEINTEPEITEEEQIENMYKEANAAITPIITDNQEIVEKTKEDAIEDAISHTTRFSPFVKEKPEVAEIETDDKEPNEKSTRIFLIVLFGILIIAIFVIPKIASLI